MKANDWISVKGELPMKIDRKVEIIDNATCRTCKHRQRHQLNAYSNKVVQCCDIQPSKRSNSGYKTIKVTDKACFSYETIHKPRADRQTD